MVGYCASVFFFYSRQTSKKFRLSIQSVFNVFNMGPCSLCMTSNAASTDPFIPVSMNNFGGAR